MQATVPTEGYDCEFISEFPNEYKCPICEKVLRDPHRVSCCDEEYCKVCIEPRLKNLHSCPACDYNNENGDISISQSRRTKRIIGQLRCHCSNQRKGCEWEGELQEMDNHLNENPTNENQLKGCNFTRVHCRYCQEMLPRNETGEHQENICQDRPFDCEYCGHHDTYEGVITIHLPECPQQPVECPQSCGLSPQRQCLATHMADECPRTVIKCDIPGCGERRQRQDMEAHNQEYGTQHTQLLALEVKELKEKLRQREEEAQRIKEQLEAGHLPITLTVSNFEQLLAVRAHWMSHLLYTKDQGYAFFLSAYVGGYGLVAGLAGDISVYVHVTRGKYDDQLEWPCRVSIEVSLLNQEEDGENVTRVINTQAGNAARNHCQGWLRFIGQRNAKQQFIKNNCLQFRVSEITEHNN